MTCAHPQTPETTRTTVHSITGAIFTRCLLCFREKRAEQKRQARVRNRTGKPVEPRPEWPDAKIEQLRALWAEGLSTAAIGRQMKITKSAVVGKAHRLNLPARPSPIRAGGAPKPPKAERPKVTLPPLASDAIHPAAERAQKQNERARIKAFHAGGARNLRDGDFYSGADERPAIYAMMREAKAAPPRLAPTAHVCQWPVTNGRPWRFCDAPAARGSYCTAHAARAYQPAREKAA